MVGGKRSRARARTDEPADKVESLEAEGSEGDTSRKKLQWYEAMATASTTLMAVVDSTYIYRAVNAAYCDENQRSEEDILGQSVAEVLGEKSFETIVKPKLDRCLLGEQVTFGFWWNSPKNGTRYVDARYEPLFEPDGSVSGVVVQVRDTTDQRRVKAQLERSVTALKGANRDLEAYGDSLAHDLKNPLLIVTNFSHYLLEDLGDSLDEQHVDHLKRIESAGRNMTYIIDDLRILTDVNHAKISQREVDLSSMGQKIIDDLRVLVPDREVAFVAEPGIMAYGDESLLMILLTNLLQNAWKYTAPSDEPRIELGVTEDERGVPIYHVRDNGIGFDNAYCEVIFQAFERLHSKAAYKGSGLGLATVERVVRRHGGRAWGEGVPGEGAIFRFTLGAPAIELLKVKGST